MQYYACLNIYFKDSRDKVDELTCNLDNKAVDVVFNVWRSHVEWCPQSNVSCIFVNVQPLLRIFDNLISTAHTQQKKKRRWIHYFIRFLRTRKHSSHSAAFVIPHFRIFRIKGNIAAQQRPRKCRLESLNLNWVFPKMWSFILIHNSDHHCGSAQWLVGSLAQRTDIFYSQNQGVFFPCFIIEGL